MDIKRGHDIEYRLYTLGDSLCLCDDEPYDNEIWEYEQVEKCWSKLPFIMEQPYLGGFSMFSPPPICLRIMFNLHQCIRDKPHFQPIKVYKNGDMLMLWDANRFLYYSYKWKVLEKLICLVKKLINVTI